MQGETLKISLNKEQSEKFISCLMDEIKRIAIELKQEREKEEQKVV